MGSKPAIMTMKTNPLVERRNFLKGLLAAGAIAPGSFPG
jgi:hypothetical protein